MKLAVEVRARDHYTNDNRAYDKARAFRSGRGGPRFDIQCGTVLTRSIGFRNRFSQCVEYMRFNEK